MANILCNWVVEERGVVLYDYNTGDELTTFIEDNFSGDELGETLIVEYNGANICHRYPNWPDTSLRTKCWRVITDNEGNKKTVK